MHLATNADIPFINSVMNHPKVRPHVWAGSDEIDYTSTIDWMWTLVIPGCGVMAAEALGDGNYLALVAFLPEAWGAEAVYAMRSGIRRIFAETDCSRLYGSVAPRNIRASRNMLGMGLRDIEKRGNRIVGHIDYCDMLDEALFRDTVLGGWSGKALYWWGVKSRTEDIPMYVPLDSIKPIFAKDGVVFDYT